MGRSSSVTFRIRTAAIGAVSLLCLPVSSQAQLDQTFYYVYRPVIDAAEECVQTTVFIDGEVMGDFFSQQTVPPNIENATCFSELSCLMDPTSNRCTELTDGVVSVSQLSVNIQESGNLLECNSGNVAIGRQLCTIAPEACTPSLSYSSCSSTIVTGEELVSDPRVLLNENPPEEVDDSVYLMYYTDAGCTDFAAMHGILEDSPNSFPIVNDTAVDEFGGESAVSCDLALACLLNPDGSTCSSLPRTGTTTLTYQNRTGDQRICFGDQTGDACTHKVDSSRCLASVSFPGCYTTQVRASDLLKNPTFYVTPPKPVSFPLNSTFYAVFYETEGRCAGSAMAVEGGVIGDTINLQKASSVDGDCASELSCLLDPFSNECFFQTKGLIDTATITVNYTSENSLLVCDASGVSFGQPLCTVNPPICERNNIYPSCTDSMVTGPELVAVPNIMQNIRPPAPVGKSAYIVFYSDPVCNDFAAMRGVVLDTYNYFPKVDDLFFYTCQDKMVCLLNPQGQACQSLSQTDPGLMAYVTMEVDSNGNQKLLLCSIDSDECVSTDDEDCLDQEFYPGCYARVVWGPDLLSNPIRYITPPTNAPTGVPSEMPSDMPSQVPTQSSAIRLSMRGRMSWILGFILSCFWSLS